MTTTALYNLGVGNRDIARDFLEQGIEIWDRLENRRRWGESKGLLAWVNYHQGDFSRSFDLYEEIYGSALLSGDAQQQTWGLVGKAENILRLGGPEHADEALSLMQEAATLPTEEIGRVEEIRVYGVLALAYLRCGDYESAREMADRAARLIAQVPPIAVGIVEGYAGTAEVYLDLLERSGDLAASQQHGLRIAAREACRALRQFGRSFPVARPRAWLLQGRHHWLRGRKARARAAWRRSLAAAEQLNLPYERGLAWTELGLHAGGTDRQKDLSRAIDIFSQLQATYDLSRAQSAAGQPPE
jgi:tetratricopeptide (TPR) repeat protein